MNVKRGLSLLGILAVVVAGCSSTGFLDGPVITSPAELLGPSGGMDAEVTGVLIYDESINCLLIDWKMSGIHSSGRRERGGRKTLQQSC